PLVRNDYALGYCSNTPHFIESRNPSLDRNCFFSPVQCMLTPPQKHKQPWVIDSGRRL
ncbi:unnamed protein product, partial [Angiostrongylus costaricensis]|uniref:Methyltransferase n=1 Tax=Angiostrongylus costaricensis TaxID=334426 RepID=A0A0R3PCP0_ANGCS